MNTQPATTDKHRIQLPDHNWALWRWSCLRTAGFPFADVLPLADSTSHVSAHLRQIASSDRFREAVAWQNRRALSGSVDALLRTPAGRRNSETRKREQLVAKYMYRFAAKNDTIGFFGPVGWARIAPETTGISVVHGPNLISKRTVYFEVWPMDALGEALCRNQELRRWIAPRRAPDIRLDGRILVAPWCAPIALPMEDVLVLAACDGQATARDIAARLDGVIDTYSVLERLNQSGLVNWKLEAPICLHPERYVRRVLDRITDAELRTAALEPLNALEDSRERIRNAGRDPDRLSRAIEELETTFTGFTGAPATRSAGRAHSARTIVFEDCSRDITVDIGADIIASLAPPLTLLLAGARWFAQRVADLARQELRHIYDALAAETHARAVDFPLLWHRAEPVVFGNRLPVDTVLAEYQRLWANLLTVPDQAHEVQYRVEDLRSAVANTFGVVGSRMAPMYHSPDILIAAADLKAIREGRYQLVLGELHVATNTLRNAVFVSEHPFPDELQSAFAADHSRPRAVPLLSKSYWPVKSGRLAPSLFAASNVGIQMAADPFEVPTSQVLPAAALIVEKREGTLRLVTRDHDMEFDLLDAFADTPLLSTHGFRVLADAPHVPRIAFDALVVARETWSFLPAAVTFAVERTEAARFAAARRWAAVNEIPRFVFVRIPSEPKPLFVDLESPPAVEIAAKAVRHMKDGEAARVVFTEMLPRPDQLWLADSTGKRYTSELRFVAFDNTGLSTIPTAPAMASP